MGGAVSKVRFRPFILALLFISLGVCFFIVPYEKEYLQRTECRIPLERGRLTAVQDPSPPDNRTIFQSFEWYLPAPSDSPSHPVPSHYTLLTTLLPHLAALGVSYIWLPPGCKATSVHDNGYGIYDLWDVGEFDAKNRGRGSRTKWGGKAELEALCARAKECGVGVLWDAVLNHKAAADEKEASMGVKVDPKGNIPPPLTQ